MSEANVTVDITTAPILTGGKGDLRRLPRTPVIWGWGDPVCSRNFNLWLNMHQTNYHRTSTRRPKFSGTPRSIWGLS